jgi:excisionase family DNA binding protein
MFYTIQSEGTDLFGSGVILKDFLLTGEDVARILQLSRALTFELMERGHIPTVRIGGSRRVLADDLEAYIYKNRLDYGRAAQAFINRRSGEREK